MTVYVDDASIPYKRMLMCHMVADSARELDAMAKRLLLRPSWFHRGHYNICQSKRAQAIGHGAQQITQRDAVAYRRIVEGQRP